MRYYQPVLTTEEWESGKLSSFEVYHYLDNAKKDYPNHKIAVYEYDEIEEPTFVDKLRTVIRIRKDTMGINPFKEWDCNHDLIFEGGRDWSEDYSKGEIDSFLSDYLSSNEITINMEKILNMMESVQRTPSPYGGYDLDTFNEDYPLSDYTVQERTDQLHDMLTEWIAEDIENKVAFCEEFGITHYSSTSTGYSQGDWAKVFICWTPEFGKTCGPSYEDTTEENLKQTFKLFEQWAWGDVYCFTVEEEETGEVLDSCCGFYGDDWKENGIMEHIMSTIEDKTEEEVLAILEDIEIEY